MKENRTTPFFNRLVNVFKAVLVVAVTTLPLYLIGRQTLGEGVVALTYLVPVTWSAYRWGQLPGISAALTAGLCFNFLFIPPLYTFVIDRLEGWLVLAIFMAVALVVVERIQASLTLAREAVLKYDLSSSLTGLRTQDAVAHAVAHQFTQMFQPAQVNVIYYPKGDKVCSVVSEPIDSLLTRRPDRILPLINTWGYCGVIQIWHGFFTELPAEDSRLFRDFTSQIARALERTRSLEAEFVQLTGEKNTITV